MTVNVLMLRACENVGRGRGTLRENIPTLGAGGKHTSSSRCEMSGVEDDRDMYAALGVELRSTTGILCNAECTTRA